MSGVWKGWVLVSRIAAQEARLAKLGADSGGVFESALMEPSKYGTRAHLVLGERTACGRVVPRDNPDIVAFWTSPREDGVAVCSQCKRAQPT